MKILIVDDEKVSRLVLTELLAPLGQTQTATDGKTAVTLFRSAVEGSAPFDLVTLDVSMPDMDGRRVLHRMREIEAAKGNSERPATIVMSTARMNKSVILDCIESGCSDYIVKPVSQARLLKKLGRLGIRVPEKVTRKDTKIHPMVMKKIIDRFHKGKIRLPVLPKVVEEIHEVLAHENASIQEVSAVVEKEPVVSGKLMRIANSPIFTGRHAVSDLRGAIVRLGIEATHAIVATITNKSLFDSDNPSLKKILEQLWAHAFATACCGKMMAEKISLGNSDTIFLMGITYDIGNVLLIKAISDFSPGTAFDDPGLLTAVQEIHTTFGANLLKKWKFPDLFVRAAELHHWNDFPPEVDDEILVLNLADAIADSIGFGFPGPALQGPATDLSAKQNVTRRLRMPDLDPQQWEAVQNDARQMIEQSIQMF